MAKTHIELSVARIRAFAAAEGHAPGTLCRLARLNQGTLRAFHRDDWHPRFETLLALESIIPEDFMPVEK